jgi:hypothetical protein
MGLRFRSWLSWCDKSFKFTRTLKPHLQPLMKLIGTTMSEMTVNYVRTQRLTLERKLTDAINKAMREFEDNTEITIDSITIEFGTYTRKDGITGTEVDCVMTKVAI